MNEKSPSRSIAESTAKGCVCPNCGHDVQPEDIFRKHHERLGETHWYPACPQCKVYCNSWDDSRWYPEKDRRKL